MAKRVAYCRGALAIEMVGGRADDLPPAPPNLVKAGGRKEAVLF